MSEDDNRASEELAFVLTLCAGLSTCIGAIVPFFVKVSDKRILAAALGFSAGISRRRRKKRKKWNMFHNYEIIK